LRRRVFVTGTGIISAIGTNTEEVLESLTRSSSGIGEISLMNTVYRQELPAAEVKISDNDLRDMAGITTNEPFSRTALLAVTAARQAVAAAGPLAIRDVRTGLVSATTTGGMDKSEVFYRSFIRDSKKGRLRDIITHDCGDSTEKIAAATGIGDYLATVSTACSSSANAILTGARLIQHGFLDRALVGGTDALTLFTINGFNSLLILDHSRCKPFDRMRNGLNLGEGAAYLMLEAGDIVQKENKIPLCEIRGFGNSCDAYHQTASSPEGTGAFLAMKGALACSGLLPSDIDYINTHGTGTKNNDLSEGLAIQRLFKGNVPKCSSTKAFTGHTLGAAGAVEAVICVLSLVNKMIFPNLNFSERMEELDFTPVTSVINDAKIDNVISNSFGFGGNNTSLIFSGINDDGYVY
jgi:3-oxoacyl-(acyl-carrier-protein) synthase